MALILQIDLKDIGKIEQNSLFQFNNKNSNIKILAKKIEKGDLDFPPIPIYPTKRTSKDKHKFFQFDGHRRRKAYEIANKKKVRVVLFKPEEIIDTKKWKINHEYFKNSNGYEVYLKLYQKYQESN